MLHVYSILSEMELIFAPVTAVAIIDDILLAGVGNIIKCYDWNLSKMCWKKRVFESSTVSGIKVLKVLPLKHAIVYGSKDLKICEVDTQKTNDDQLKSVFYWKSQDWILDVMFVYSEHDSNLPSMVAAALGHNFVSLIDWRAKVEVEVVHCEEKCIIYSAHFVNELRPTWQSLTLCSGTVFNQMITWKPAEVNSVTKFGVIIDRVHAHDGVIFSIDSSFDSSLLLTASDDRSVRLWRCPSISDMSVNKNTNLLCKLYGHESRVWKAFFFDFYKSNYVVSVGEDGYCIIWDITYSSRVNHESIATIIKKYKCHKGRNIWSIFLNEDYLVTGGGDGAVRLWKIMDFISKPKITGHPFQCCTDAIGTLKSIHLCDNNIVIGHTDFGFLVKFDAMQLQWSKLHRDDSFKSYSVMSVCHEVCTAAIGNTKGELKILSYDKHWDNLKFSEMLKVAPLGNKVHNLSWKFVDSTAFLFLTACDGDFILYKLNISSFCIDMIFCWTLPMARNRWHMAAIPIIFKDTIYAICGDRRGSLHLYKQGTPEPLQTAYGIHGRNGVTSIQAHGESVITTGRDGVWRRMQIDFKKEQMKFLTQNKAAQGMEWLESSIPICDKPHEAYIIGFHGRNFILWSSETGDTLFMVGCGGGHRDWSFITSNGKAVFVFLKQSILHIAMIEHTLFLENSLLQPHLHSGHITCLKHILSWSRNDYYQELSLFVTGSEDTTVVLFLHIKGAKHDNQLMKLCSVDDHVCGVRAITFHMSADSATNSKVFLFTAGGRAAIKWYDVTIDKEALNLQKTCAITLVCSLDSFYWTSLGESNVMRSVDIDIRFMDLTCWSEGGKLYLSAVCSDARVRLFWVDTKENDINLLLISPAMSHCFLTIQSFALAKRRWIATGATDGIIRIWKISQGELECVLSHKTHTSGINSMDIFTPVERSGVNALTNTLYIATGGDDNAIHITQFIINEKECDLKAKYVMDQAHSSQLTGLKFAGKRDTDFNLISTSIDQRVVKWNIYYSIEDLSINFANSILTNIPDVSALEVWKTENGDLFCAVCGMGLQFIRF